MIDKQNIKEKFEQIQEYWHPRIAAELNGQYVKLVKIKGEFEWHKHEEEDEMFLVIDGEFEMELREKTITIQTGEFIIIPKGIEHRPVAKKEAQILLFEPKSTLNTGDQNTSPLTKSELDWI